MQEASAAILAREKKLGKDLESTADNWRWKFNLPQKPNYDNIYYYKKSKKIFNAPCYDLDLDKPPDSYKGQFLQVKNALHQTEHRLSRAQEDAKKKKIDLLQQWKELEDRELKLRNNFIQFNRFLGRNMTKRTRAEQKFNEMNAMKLEYTEKINKMKMESEDIKKYTEAVKQNVSTHRIYEDFLNIVVSTGHFRTIPHIINRYAILDEARQKVGQDMYVNSEEYHSKRQNYAKLMENTHITYLSLSNELSELRRKYDDAKNRTKFWGMVLNDICNKYSAVAQNISWSRMALRHMFDMAFFRVRRRRKRLVKKTREDLGKMLRINETLRALGRVETQLRKLYGQKTVHTSLDPTPESFEVKHAVPKQPSNKMKTVMDKLKDEKKKKGRPSESERQGDYLMVDTTKKAVDGDNLDDVCPIRLGQEKWRYAKVKNFEELYKRALLGIREEKVLEKLRELTYRGSGFDITSFSSSNVRSNKAKWAAAAVAQKTAKRGTEIQLPTPTANVSARLTLTSHSALTVLEDEDVDPLYDVHNLVARKMQKKKAIEKKFTILMDAAYDKDKQALPSVSAGYQGKGKRSSRPSTSVQ